MSEEKESKNTNEDKEFEEIEKEVKSQLDSKHKLSKDVVEKEQRLWKRDEVFTFKPTFVIFISILLFIVIIMTLILPINTTFHKRFDTISKAFTISNTLLIIFVIYATIQFNASNQERADRAESHEISEKIYEEFLNNVRLLLTTINVHSKVIKMRDECEKEMPDGKGGMCCWDVGTQGPFRPIGC